MINPVPRSSNTSVLDPSTSDLGPQPAEDAAVPVGGGAHRARQARPAAVDVTVLAVLEWTVWSDTLPRLISGCLGVFVLLGWPTVALMSKTRRRSTPGFERFVLSVAAAVLGALLLGLAVNTFLPVVEVEHPLSRNCVLLTSLVANIAATVCCPSIPVVDARAVLRVATQAIGLRPELVRTLALVSLGLAVCGSVRLNNDAGGLVAELARAGIVMTVVALIVRRGSTNRDLFSLWACGCGLLLATSLRGWYITGHDIQREYLSFLLTNGAQHWSMSVYPSPYNACLSINIFPSMLVRVTGWDGEIVFKVLLQLLFSLVVPTVYLLARRVVNRRSAVVSVAFFIFFPTFFVDMPYLCRQETAFFFVVVTLVVATNKRWPVRLRRLAAVAGVAGVVVSHYSTTYFLLMTLLAAALVVAAMRLWQRLRSGRSAQPGRRTALVLLSPVVLVTALAMSWAWTSPATHSGGHLLDVLSATKAALVSGTSPIGSSDENYSIFGGSSLSDQDRFDQFTAATTRAVDRIPAADRVFVHPTAAESNPALLPASYRSATGLGKALSGAGVDLQRANNAARFGFGALFQVLLLAGLVCLLLIRRVRRRFSDEAGAIVIGSTVALGLIVVVPGLSADYGVLRAFQQLLLSSSFVLAIGLSAILPWSKRWARLCAAAVIGLLGLCLLGPLPATVGGYQPQIAQDNSGLYYNLYYVSDAESAATSALARFSDNALVQSEIVTDKVSAARLQDYVSDSVGVDDDFFPSELTRGCYVYLGAETVRENRATIFYGGDLLTYRYPWRSLQTQLDLVYSNPDSRIYR